LHREFVFAASKGKPRQPIRHMNNTTWQTARKKAGLAQVRVHDLKHTFGRRLRTAGVSLETRRVLLGHKSGDITSHYSAPELAELIRAANAVLKVDSDDLYSFDHRYAAASEAAAGPPQRQRSRCCRYALPLGLPLHRVRRRRTGPTRCRGQGRIRNRIGSPQGRRAGKGLPDSVRKPPDRRSLAQEIARNCRRVGQAGRDSMVRNGSPQSPDCPVYTDSSGR